MTTSPHMSAEEIARSAETINTRGYEELPLPVKAHLKECDQCATEVLMVAELIAEESSEAEEGKKSKKGGVQPWQYALVSLAIAAAILFFVVRVVDFYPNQSSNDNLVGQLPRNEQAAAETEKDRSLPSEETNREEANNEKATTSEEKPQPAEDIVKEESAIEKQEAPAADPDLKDTGTLLAAFTPNEELEELYSNMRGAYRSNDVILTSDSIVYLKNTDSLTWQNPQENILYVEIFNNQGTEVSSKEVNTSRGVQLPALPNGLYYWKLLNEDFDLLFVGKIVADEQDHPAGE